MLKTILRFLIIFALFYTIPIIAQPGIKAGLNLSALQSSQEDFRPFLGYEVSWVQEGTSNPVFGLDAGLFYTLQLSDAFNLQPGLCFAQRGYQFDQTPLYNTNYSLRINYIQLPVLFEYKLPLNWSFSPFITAGPFTAVKLGSNKKISISDKVITGDLPGVNTFDYGIVFGIGAEVDAWDGQIIFDLSVNWGLANVMTQPDDFIRLPNDPGTVKTRVVMLMTGYRFNTDW